MREGIITVVKIIEGNREDMSSDFSLGDGILGTFSSIL